jgi:AcrR family transcriptional regulator
MATASKPNEKRARRRRPKKTLSRREQGEQTRRAILDAAMELYAETGVRGTGLIAIGQRAGVHHATVLYHYRNSRELLLAVLTERDRRFVEFVRDAYAEGGLSAIRALPIVGRFNLQHPVWAKLFAVLQIENLDEKDPAHAYFVARRNDGALLIRTALHQARARGEIRADVDEETTITAILAFTAGIQIQHFLDPDRVDLLATFDRFTDMVVADLTRGLSSAAVVGKPKAKSGPRRR